MEITPFMLQAKEISDRVRAHQEEYPEDVVMQDVADIADTLRVLIDDLEERRQLIEGEILPLVPPPPT